MGTERNRLAQTSHKCILEVQSTIDGSIVWSLGWLEALERLNTGRAIACAVKQHTQSGVKFIFSARTFHQLGTHSGTVS